MTKAIKDAIALMELQVKEICVEIVKIANDNPPLVPGAYIYPILCDVINHLRTQIGLLKWILEQKK